MYSIMDITYTYKCIYITYIIFLPNGKGNSYKLECTEALIKFFSKTVFFFIQQSNTLYLHKKYKLENQSSFSPHLITEFHSCSQAALWTARKGG